MAGTERKLFVRQATGLVREIGPLVAIIIVITNTVGLGWQKRAFQFSGPAIVPESQYVLGLPPIAMAFIVVGIVVLLTVWTFAILGAAMPRSGGGYVYISRIISPPVGFIASWMEYFSIAVSWGLIGTAVFEAILIYAWIARLPGNFIAAIATPEALFIGGVIIVVAFAAVAALGVRMTGLLLQVIFWIPAAITVLIYGIMLGASPSALEAGVRTLSGVTPTFFTQKALQLGMATAFKGSYWDAVNVAVLGAYWAYIGFAASTFVAGEIKEATKSLPRTLFIADAFIILLYISMSILAYRTASLVGKVGDYSFFSAYAYLSYGVSGGLSKAGIDAARAWTPNIAGFAALGSGLGGLILLIPVFAVLWVANDIPPFILTSTRIIFAMAFDRVLPEKLADVSERWHSPTNAVLLTMVVALIGNFAESDLLVKYLGSGNIVAQYINSGGGVAATDIWDTIFFLVSALAGALFVFRRKEIYEASAYKPTIGVVQSALVVILSVVFFGSLVVGQLSPLVFAVYILVLILAVLAKSVGKQMPAVTTIGSVAVIANIWLMIAEFKAYGFQALEPWYFTIFLIVVGGLLFGLYKSRGSRVGVDYSTIYAQIPPE